MLRDIYELTKTAINPVAIRLDSDNLTAGAEQLAKKILRINDRYLINEEEDATPFPKSDLRQTPSFVTIKGNLELSADYILEGINPGDDQIRQNLLRCLSEGFVTTIDWAADDRFNKTLQVSARNSDTGELFLITVSDRGETVGLITRDAQTMRYKAHGNKVELEQAQNILDQADEVTRKYRPSTWLYKGGEIRIIRYQKTNEGERISQQAVFNRNGEMKLTVYEQKILEPHEVAGRKLEKGQFIRETVTPEYLKANPGFQRHFISTSNIEHSARPATPEETTLFLQELLKLRVDKPRTVQKYESQRRSFGFFGDNHGNGRAEMVKDIGK